MPINYSKYPLNWKTEIVPRILKKANNKCELCGLENHSTIYTLSLYVRSATNGKYGFRSIWFRHKDDALRHVQLGIFSPKRVILAIAHLDHDETNHNVAYDRLAALCQICHCNYDIDEKYKRKRKITNDESL